MVRRYSLIQYGELISRGPYKRRTSSLYQHQHQHLGPNPNPTHHHQNQHQSHQDQIHFDLFSTHNAVHEQAYAAPPPPSTNSNPNSDANAISQAFAAAFTTSGPRWINGRRQSIQPGHTQPQGYSRARGVQIQHQHPHPNPHVPPIVLSGLGLGTGGGGGERRDSLSTTFPLGLNTMSGQDPFSRAVSPIGSGHGHIKKSKSSRNANADTNANGANVDPSLSGSGRQGNGITAVDYAYRPTPTYQYVHSAPTSPTPSARGPPGIGNHVNTFGQNQTAASFFPPPPPPQAQISSRHLPLTLLSASGENIRLDKIRRPSLHTLMIHSRPSSPVQATGPVPSPFQALSMSISNPTTDTDHQMDLGVESPTLFNGTGLMDIDDPESNHRLFIPNELSAPSQGHEGGRDNEGGVGKLRLSIGSEGLGLGLGLELGHVG